MTTRRYLLIPLALASGLAITACSQPASTPEADTTSAASAESTAAESTDEANSADGSAEAEAPAEVSSPQARLVATYDGGIVVLDAETLEPVTDIPLEGFNRLNRLGDERNVVVSTPQDSRS